MVKKFFYLIVLLVFIAVLSSNLVYSARVYGSIYDQEMNTINQVVVEVNSTPRQRHVSRYGGYSFELEPGLYLMEATLTRNGTTITIAEEYVEVLTQEGEYIVDLFINPEINLTGDRIEIVNEQVNLTFFWILSFSSLLILGISIFTITKIYKKNKKEISVEYNIQYDSHDNDIKVQEEEINSESIALKNRILKILTNNGGKATQKEIRKKIPLSESKISQIITELCEEKKILKKKEGRSNILIIN